MQRIPASLLASIASVVCAIPGARAADSAGVSEPADTPHRALPKVFSAILQDPGTRKRLAAEAAEPRDMEPEEFRKYIRDEVKKWTEIAKTAGIRVN